MANTNDVIVIDLEKFPHLDGWGEKLGGNLGLEYFYLEDQYFDYIPSNIKYLRFSAKEALFGTKYWGETRYTKSDYGENEEGTTQKDKVEVDTTLVKEYTIPFMKAVIRLAIQEIFERRYIVLRSKYSTLEDATWGDQFAEATAYLEDNTATVKLIDRLAELRGLTLADFAAKVVEKHNEWKDSVYDLAVSEQSVSTKLKACANMAEVNVFLEDYFGVAMSNQQCLEYNRCTIDDETGNIERKEPFVYGIRF
jgi:hypothetical protein